MTRRTKPIEKPRPQIGDFYASSIFDADHHVARKTGNGFLDYDRCTGCVTREGAEELAALMNAARKLAERHSNIVLRSPFKGGDPKLWAAWVIMNSISRAIDGPQPELFHEFLQRRDHERCEACKPTPIACEAA